MGEMMQVPFGAGTKPRDAQPILHAVTTAITAALEAKYGDAYDVDGGSVIDDFGPFWMRTIDVLRGWHEGASVTVMWEMDKPKPHFEVQVAPTSRIEDRIMSIIMWPLIIVGAIVGVLSIRFGLVLGPLVGGILGLVIHLVLGAPIANLITRSYRDSNARLADEVEQIARDIAFAGVEEPETRMAA